MAKYINHSEEINSAINARMSGEIPLKSQNSEVNNSVDTEPLVTKNEKKGNTKPTSIRLPESMINNVVKIAITGHDNNFTTYIKDLIMEDFERNKEYYLECYERRKKREY